MPKQHARIVRVGHDYVRLVNVEDSLVILTDKKDEAGWYSEMGAAIVIEMVRELYPAREIMREVTH
jgi:hypothetical protein